MRWIICIVIILLLLIAALSHPLYHGNNAWRVWWHHGVSLPRSAHGFVCTGSTTTIPDLFGGHSEATFTIDSADLSAFLAQFQEGVHNRGRSGGIYVTSKPWSQPITPSGEAWGPSPGGRDFYMIKWTTIEDGVRIELDTDWN